MPTIESADEARQVAQLITSGQLTGAPKDAAMAALRTFDAQTAPPQQPSDRRADAPSGTFVDPKTGQPVVTSQPSEGTGTLGDAGRRVLEPVRRSAEGLAQVATMLDPDNGASYKAVTKAVDTRRSAYNAAHPEDSSTVNDLMAGAVPVAGAGGEATAATGFLKSLARRMFSGAAISGTQYVPEGGSRAENMAAGGLFGGLAHTITGALPGIRNSVSRIITKSNQNRARVADVANAARDFFDPNTAPSPAPYTVAQQTGSPALTRLEQKAYGPVLQELHAQQADQAAARFTELADQAGATAKIIPKSQDVANAVNDTLTTTVRGMRATRSNAFTSGMSEVAALSGPGGGPGVVPLTNLTNAYESIIAQDSNAFNIHGATLPSGVQATLDALRKAPGAKVKVPTLQYIMQGLGQDAPHGAGAFLPIADARLEMYRNQLKDALAKDIDGAGLKTGTNPAFTKLQDVRKTYAQQSDQLRTIEDGTLNRLFGDPKALAEPGAALDRFYSMRSSDQVAAVDLLQKNHPEVLDAMRAHRINTSVTDATAAGAAKNSAFDIEAFNKSMFGGDAKNSPLWGNDLTSQKVRAGAAHLKVLLNAGPGGPGSPVGPEDVAINLVSMTPAFIARAVTRVVYGSQGDKLLGTPEGLAALRTLVNVSSRKSAAGAQALAYIVGLSQQPSQNAQPGTQQSASQ